MSRHPLPIIPPLGARMTEGRPVLAQKQVTMLTEHLLGMTSMRIANVSIAHTAFVTTRMSNDQVLSGDDGDVLEIYLLCRNGRGAGATIHTNQLDESVLRTIVQRAEEVAREKIVPVEDVLPAKPQVSDELVRTQLWHESTIRAMSTVRDTVIPDLMLAIKGEQLKAAGFIGLMARSETIMNKDGIKVYNEETDSEVTMNARVLEGKSSGWGGQAARDWSIIDHRKIVNDAIRWAKLGVNPVAMEPGRRTAILSASAVAQLLRFLGEQFDAVDTDSGRTGFSKHPTGNKLRMRVFDPRINMTSDPADPDGGYRPYFRGDGYGSPAMSWVEQGVLKNLAYDPGYAMERGKSYSEQPWSLRVSGGNTSVEQMIAQCKEGIYVNHVSSVDLVDKNTGLLTGVTRDGCFYVKDGKIERPIKNFRFTDSPFFFLNSIEALGPTQRAAFGYTPRSDGESWLAPTDWPRRPMIVPPMMVRDFNFSALADAV